MTDSSTDAGAQARRDIPNKRPSPEVQKALRHEIRKKYAAKIAPGRVQAILRKHSLECVYADRYGGVLPDDAFGRTCLFVLFHHIVNIAKIPDPVLKASAVKWAPWLDDTELEEIIVRVFKKPLRWKAAKLGKLIKLTNEERERLKIKTIEAFDVTPRDRREENKRKDREYRAAKRRKEGVTSRDQYLAKSLAKTAPWEAEGITRRSWERRRKKEREKAVTTAVTSRNAVTVTAVSQVCREYTSSALYPTHLRHSDDFGLSQPKPYRWTKASGAPCIG
jgi:hypothetical protein